MNILICLDSFKDSITAYNAGEALKKGLQKASKSFSIKNLPVADGGEGTVDALVKATGGKRIELKVKDALMRTTDSFYGMLGDGKTAVIEMAAASGIEKLTREERNPMTTSTFGTGQLIAHAIKTGCKNIIIGIGGSATNDGGVGMAMALGAKFIDKDGNEVAQGGGNLQRIANIDLTKLNKTIKGVSVTVACDVDNPLTGPEGAAAVYGPQKGATPEMVDVLDKGLNHLSGLIDANFNKQINTIPGAGAAGGLGGGLLAFLNAELKPGFEIVKNTLNLKEEIGKVDLVFTGEGKMDFQTKFGKTPHGVAKIAKASHIPVIAIAGTLGDNYQELNSEGFSSIFSILDRPCDLDFALKNAAQLIENLGEQLGHLMYMSVKKAYI
ncbi:glycerate kinase [Bacteroidales bacterium]|nr:glycerate kinase [Bacteroidales bacterium]